VSHPDDNALALVSRIAGRRPWWWIGAWAVDFVALGAFAGRAQGVLSNGGFDVPGSQSERVVAYFQALPVRGSQPFTFLVDAPDRGTASARLAAVVAAAHAAHPEQSETWRSIGGLQRLPAGAAGGGGVLAVQASLTGIASRGRAPLPRGNFTVFDVHPSCVTLN